jgi:hypothetical protein
MIETEIIACASASEREDFGIFQYRLGLLQTEREKKFAQAE